MRAPRDPEAASFRRMHKCARRLGLSVPECDRLVAEARAGVASAVAAGLPRADVICGLSSDGAGSVALFVGDLASVLVGMSDREASARAVFSPSSSAVH